MRKRWQTAPISDEEDAEITAAALSDPDNPPLTDEQMDRMRPARDVVTREVFERLTGTKAVFVPEGVVDHFKRAFGADWEEEIRDILRAAAEKGREAAE